MATVTAQRIKTHELRFSNGCIATVPPSLAVGGTTAFLDTGATMRFHRKGQGLIAVDGNDGFVIARSHPTHHLHQHTIDHLAHTWNLMASRSWLGAERPARRGLLYRIEDGAASFESSYFHYASDWQNHRRFHRGWITGTLLVEDEVPLPVLALGLRVTLGRHWFDLEVGTWSETRREWDFAGF